MEERERREKEREREEWGHEHPTLYEQEREKCRVRAAGKKRGDRMMALYGVTHVDKSFLFSLVLRREEASVDARRRRRMRVEKLHPWHIFLASVTPFNCGGVGSKKNRERLLALRRLKCGEKSRKRSLLGHYQIHIFWA